jgi:hypothetical protein
VRFDAVVAEDEIDLDSGFIMLPAAIPQAVPMQASAGEPTAPAPPPGPTGGGGHPSVPQPGSAAALQTHVELSFSANRNQLFDAWNAIANLADFAGKVAVTVHAEKADGFDKSKLQNGVIEPLREGNLIP